MTFYGNPSRYLQELDIATKNASSTVDAGIEPLKQTADFANVNWTGVKMVEEEWKAGAAGKFTRVRYYRGAVWMQRRSTFTITPVDASGVVLGAPITADAGWDDRLSEHNHAAAGCQTRHLRRRAESPA